MTGNQRRPRGSAATPISCRDCYAWGLLPSRRCTACTSFRWAHPEIGACSSCHRLVPLKRGYCRLCWCQAGAEAKAQGWTPSLAPVLHRVRDHQLFLAGLQRQRARKGQSKLGKQGRRTPRPAPTPAIDTEVPGWVQPALFASRRDLVAFDRDRHADLTNPWLVHAQYETRSWGLARGWPEWVLREVDRALVIVLSGHTGEKIRYSEIFSALSRRALGVLRPAEILDRLGLLDDDRPAAFDLWLQRKLADLPPGIRRDVEHWLRTLRDGGPRTAPRALPTAWVYLNNALPALATWSTCYDHLREVTRDDVTAIADAAGGRRHDRLTALRSLFRHCKRSGTIFRDPTSRVRVGRYQPGELIPLQPSEIEEALTAATTPVARLAVALAAIHAARPKAIRLMRLDDVDLGNRRLVIGGRARRLDDLTRQALTEWLDHRRRHWPDTANPHLIISRNTAMDNRPASGVWITQHLRGKTATLERLRVDRQLEEAPQPRPGPAPPRGGLRPRRQDCPALCRGCPTSPGDRGRAPRHRQHARTHESTNTHLRAAPRPSATGGEEYPPSAHGCAEGSLNRRFWPLAAG